MSVSKDPETIKTAYRTYPNAGEEVRALVNYYLAPGDDVVVREPEET